MGTMSLPFQAVALPACICPCGYGEKWLTGSPLIDSWAEGDCINYLLSELSWPREGGASAVENRSD